MNSTLVSSATKKWIYLSIVVFILFVMFVIMFDFVNLPLWLVLGGAATEAGRRFVFAMLSSSSTSTTATKLVNNIEISFVADVQEKMSKENNTEVDESNVKTEHHHKITQQCQPPDGLTSEVEKYIKIIMNQYICSWYNNLATNDQFSSEIEYALEDLIVAFISRLRQIHSRHLTTKVLKVYHKYFQQFVAAKKQGQRLEDVFTDFHFALESEATENRHISNVVNVLLEVLVPADILCCPTGRHLVVSLLANQVIHRLVNLISDPKFINRCILLVMGLDPDDGNNQARSNSYPTNCISSPVQMDHPSSSDSRFNSDEKLHLETGTMCDYMKDIWQRLADDMPSSFKLERQQEVNEMLLNSRKQRPTKLPKSSSFDRISDLLPSNFSLEYISNNVTQYFRSLPGKDSCDSENFNDDDVDIESPCQSESQKNGVECTSSTNFQVSSGLQGLLSLTTGPVLCETLPTVCRSKVDLNVKKTFPFEADTAGELENQAEEKEKTASSSCNDAMDNDELLNSEENPFIKLEITTAEVMEGSRPGSQYAVYCIQYDAWFPDADNIKTVDLGNYIDVLKPKTTLQTVTVRRRFREFVSLHSRLEDQLKSQPFFKSLKGPNKWSIIPFGKLDKDTIETRRKFLENYLQTMISNPESAKCTCLREFLAYGSDDKTIFGRKPTDIGQFVPRLDKLLMKKMTGVFDKLKTALPNLPSEPFTVTSVQTPSPGESSAKAADRFLGYFNIIPTGNQDGVSSSMLFDYGAEEDMSASLENRIGRFLSSYDSNSDKVDIAFDAAEMDKWTNDPWTSTSNVHSKQSIKPAVDVNTRWQQTGNDEISEAILNLLFEAFNDGSIFKRDNFVHTTKIVLGNTLNSYLCGVIDSCTTEEAFVIYLQLIREKLWPTNIHVKTSFKSSFHYYELVRQALSSCIPSIATTVVGKDQIDDIIRMFLDSFQSPKLLRHIVYCLLDVLVDDLLIRSRRQSIMEKLRPII